MNRYSRILAAVLVSALLVGCGPPRVLDDATFNAGLDPRDQRIIALVAWLKQKGVTLEYTGTAEGGGGWRVTEPKTSGDYHVVFSIRSFPDWASEAQMREALDINLAHMLNAPTHLAMSYGGTHGKNTEAKGPASDDELPKVGGVAVTQAVEQWFKEYKARDPAAANPASALRLQSLRPAGRVTQPSSQRSPLPSASSHRQPSWPSPRG